MESDKANDKMEVMLIILMLLVVVLLRTVINERTLTAAPLAVSMP